MNTNYTQKSAEALNTAQSMAEENRNNYIAPEHLLYALIDQDGGLIGSLLKKMGADTDAVLTELDTAIDNLPKVGTMEGRAYLSPETDRVIKAAEQAGKVDGGRICFRRASDGRNICRGDTGDQKDIR